MNKSMKAARASAKGGFNLLWATAISMIISLIGGILIARLLDPSQMGIIAIVMIAPNLLILVREWGVNSATIKYLAQSRSENKNEKIKAIILANLSFEVTMGTILTIVLILFSGVFAFVLARPHIQFLIILASFMILGGALLIGSQSLFIGFERMELYGFTTISQSLFRSMVAPILILFGWGVVGVIVGTSLSFIIAGLFGVTLFFLVVYSKMKFEKNQKTIFKILKELVRYGFPLSISAILRGLLLQFYMIIAAFFAIDIIFGNYQIATSIASILTFFILPIGIALFPAFPKFDPKKENRELSKVFSISTKYTAYLVAPAICAIFVLSQHIIFTLYGFQYLQAPLLLSLFSLTFILTVFGTMSVDYILKGQGKTRVNLGLTIILLAFGIPLSLILIPTFGIIGLIFTFIIHGIPSAIVGLLWVRKRFSATVPWGSIVRILFASVLSGLIVFMIVTFIVLPIWVELIIGGIIFFAAYIIISPLLKAINHDDIQVLREAFKAIGPFSRILNFVLTIIEKLTR